MMPMPPMLAYPQRATPRKKSTKWHGALPVSAIEKVLAQDNRFADSLLTEKLKRIRTDRYRAQRLLDWQEQSFVLRQAIKETELREMGIPHTSFLPEIVMKMTEPDVRARRPFGRVRRSVTEEELKADKTSKAPPFLNDLQTRDSRRTVTTVKSDPFLEDANNKDIFTRLHGIDLPLYGPQSDAKREKREREFVHYLQRQQTKAKVTLDPRFRKLEQSLIRDETNLLVKLPRGDQKLSPTSNKNNNDDEQLVHNDLRVVTKSAKVIHKVQTELARKPKSVFAKSVWIDFS
ncbi:uncharacterized protein LOC110980451 [Acanthaster planci]|uniref:Uncharacterized protein LOC110980451 n=1 Tax=Acanthaster planci TaxID=133434 RepID=A0A8B7YHU8_ACAPL|nr:uncharacterized protein LOC110980451 [Acanthaster planci]